MTDEEILTKAAEVLARRKVARTAELERLFKKYARSRLKAPHDLGKPKKLLPEEALVLYALERNKFVVEAYQTNGLRWHGDATCKFHARGGAMTIGAATRLDLLWELWATVSHQSQDCGEWGHQVSMVTLNEDHLNGSVFHHDVRELNRELRQQEREEREALTLNSAAD